MTDKSGHRTPLIQALLNPRIYGGLTAKCKLIETHISWVILTGRFAYKLKKPVNLGFLDFSTLEKRRFYCEEELRLNRRMAPDIYLAVLPISGSVSHPVIAGNGTVMEYAVKMREFPQASQLDRMLERGELQDKQIDAFARRIAQFHQAIPVADKSMDYGTPQHITQPVVENFMQILHSLPTAESKAPLKSVQDWSEERSVALKNTFTMRKQQGFVREGHGDLHLRNLAWVDDTPIAFDCIEFNPYLRWIDVLSEVAFLVMDLHDREQAALAQRFLNTYLEQTGDYEGVVLLPFYLVYRAMVRAKVAAIRLQQTGLDARAQQAALREFHDYLALAQRYTTKANPCLVITRGPSASGKSTVTQSLLEALPALRLRSDVERKRLHQVAFNESGGAALYTKEATEKTYNRLFKLTAQLLDAGQSVIVDAVNGSALHRHRFQSIAEQRNIPYVLLDFIVRPEVLRDRIVQRQREVSDADLQVLESQLRNWLSLPKDEAAFAINIDAEQVVDVGQLQQSIAQRCANY